MFAALFWGVGPAHAEQGIVTLTIQNDLAVKRDGGGYTSGLFGAHLRLAAPDEAGVEPVFAFKPLGGWLSLEKPTLASVSFKQLIITPAEIAAPVPDPTDSPYTGLLALRLAQVHARANVADMFALEIGVVGPGSGAAQTQRFVHRVTASRRPEGWESQSRNRAMLGLEAYRSWRFARSDETTATPGTDLVLLGGGALGNLQSSFGGEALLRYGTGLARSFPTAVRLGGTGSDPLSVGRGWFLLGGLAVDHYFERVGFGNSAPPASTARLRQTQVLARAGFAYGGGRSSVSVSVQSASPLVAGRYARQSYGSITYSHGLD